MFNGCFKKFLGTLQAILFKIKWTDFGVKLNLHIYKTVKDFKTSSLIDIAAANVCTMKKTRGLYHVSERRYFNFSPGHFFGNCGYTYRAGCRHWQLLILVVVDDHSCCKIKCTCSFTSSKQVKNCQHPLYPLAIVFNACQKPHGAYSANSCSKPHVSCKPFSPQERTQISEKFYKDPGSLQSVLEKLLK